MGLLDKIMSKLTDKAVEKYSDGWDERTTWLVIAVAALALFFLRRPTSDTNVPPWNDDDTRAAVLDGMDDAELQAELERRTKPKGI